jgi:RNA polymerase sigma factor (sigma-70 family)
VASVEHAGGLTRAQERALVVAAERGDADASRRLVEAFMPAIAGLARGFPAGAGIEPRELVHEGVAGLLFAARRYDPSLNTTFWTYASFWVRKAMQELVAELTRPVALSDRAVRALAHVRTARRDHVRAHGAEPTNEQLSAATGLTRAQLESLQATEQRARALEEPLEAEGETSGTIGDTIADPTAELAYEQVLDELELYEVRHVAEKLDERERGILRAHYGLDQSAETLDQIGGRLGLTAERARQIEAVALRKMRDALTRPRLRSELRPPPR